MLKTMASHRKHLALITFILLFFVCLSCSKKHDGQGAINRENLPNSEGYFLIDEQGDTLPTGVPIRLKEEHLKHTPIVSV